MTHINKYNFFAVTLREHEMAGTGVSTGLGQIPEFLSFFCVDITDLLTNFEEKMSNCSVNGIEVGCFPILSIPSFVQNPYINRFLRRICQHFSSLKTKCVLLAGRVHADQSLCRTSYALS